MSALCSLLKHVHLRPFPAAGASQVLRSEGQRTTESPLNNLVSIASRPDGSAAVADGIRAKGGRMMFTMKSRALLRVTAAGSAVAGIAMFGMTGSAAAISTTQTVAGTTQSSISLAIGTPVSGFTTGFQPGSTATTSGTLVATSTSSAPALQVEDATSTSNKGHMQAAATGCTSSESALTDALSVTVPSGAGFTSSGAVSVSGTNQTVASATAPVAAATVTTNYSQTIGSGEALLTGCVYNITNTYTLS
jgi:hypothetical protein